MELLLILAAMLSAVTGAFTGARGPEARVHQSEAAIGAQLVASAGQEQPARAIAAVPANVLPSIEVAVFRPFALAAAIPLYADRLLE